MDLEMEPPPLRAYDLRPFFRGEWDQMTPQHWGVLAGCITYIVTVSVVLVLLVLGGSFQRMREQAKEYREKGPRALATKFERFLLYDELLEARKRLTLRPSVADAGDCKLSFKYVRLEVFNAAKHGAKVYQVSSGAPVYAHGPYNAEEEIWRFLADGPFESEAALLQSSVMGTQPDSERFVVIDTRTNYVVGMVALMENDPASLRIRIGDVWITPAFQRTHVHTDLHVGLLNYLFAVGYRRVEWKTDARNARSRKAVERLGYQLEGVMRKYTIVRDSNQDTALYSMTNSDWRDFHRQRATKMIKSAKGVSAPSAKDLEAGGKKGRNATMGANMHAAVPAGVHANGTGTGKGKGKKRKNRRRGKGN